MYFKYIILYRIFILLCTFSIKFFILKPGTNFENIIHIGREGEEEKEEKDNILILSSLMQFNGRSGDY